MEQNSMVAGSSWSWNHPELDDPAQVDLDPDPVLDPGPDPALDPGPGQDPGVAVTSLGIGLRADQGQDHLRLETGLDPDPGALGDPVQDQLNLRKKLEIKMAEPNPDPDLDPDPEAPRIMKETWMTKMRK